MGASVPILDNQAEGAIPMRHLAFASLLLLLCASVSGSSVTNSIPLVTATDTVVELTAGRWEHTFQHDGVTVRVTSATEAMWEEDEFLSVSLSFPGGCEVVITPGWMTALVRDSIATLEMKVQKNGKVFLRLQENPGVHVGVSQHMSNLMFDRCYHPLFDMRSRGLPYSVTGETGRLSTHITRIRDE